MKKTIILLMLFLFIGLVACTKSDDQNEFKRNNTLVAEELRETEMAQIGNEYLLAWADEFNYEGTPDPNRWNFEVGTGNGGWGNGELQCYTKDSKNANVANGLLTITSLKENYGGCNYTSARLTTKAKGDWKYGYIEIRAKLPTGKGTWPALWMMPTNSEYGTWPKSGEIDIMETTGYNPNKILGTIHTGSYNHKLNTQKGGYTSISNSTTDFNLYGIEWNEKSIQFKVNGTNFFTYNYDERLNTSDTSYMAWPFDKEFFLIMNIAMGGSMGGEVDVNFEKAEMQIDYVRVYKKVTTDDNEKPSVVEMTSTTPTSSSIFLEWNKAKDNTSIRHYEIVVDNKQIGATLKNNYLITGLKENTNYKVRVIAVDWNNNYSITGIMNITTLSIQNVPGKVTGYAYTLGEGVEVINGSDSEGGKVLKFNENSEALYEINSQASGNYHLSLRLAAVQNCEVTIYIVANNVETKLETLSISASYGKYNDIALTNLINLPKGNVSFKITCTGKATGNAMLLNYLKIE